MIALAPRLIAYALARTGCRGTAEDIAQEALAALVTRWRKGGPPVSPEAFVFAIAKRRAGRAIARRALLAPLDLVRGAASSVPTPAESYESRRRLGEVRAALPTLPRADREALLLRAVAELSFDDIAALMRSSPAAVKMRISRARKQLAALVPEYANGRRSRTA